MHYASWPEVHQLVVLEGGRVAGVGRFSDFQTRFGALLGLEKNVTDDADNADSASTTSTLLKNSISVQPPIGCNASADADSVALAKSEAAAAALQAMGAPQEKDDDVDEAYAKGAVSRRHLLRYISSCGSCAMLSSLATLFVSQQVRYICVE